MDLNPFEWFDSFTPEADATPAQLNRWRNKVAFAVTMIFIALVAAPFGLEYRYATAGELDTVHGELSKSIDSVKDDVKGVKSAVDSLAKSYAEKDKERADREKATAIRDVRRQIFSTAKDACAASGPAKDLLMQQVEELRTEFMALTGTEYPVFDCRNIR